MGGRFVSPLGEKFFFAVRADVGGFGVGSDFTWNTAAGLGWHISRLIDLAVNYRYLDVDYENGDPGTADFFAYDGSQQGFLVGLNFNF